MCAKRITRTVGITRRTHRKSKLGCQQCRKRRVKCDESLPSCEGCLARSMRCSYLDLSQEEIQKIQLAHLEVGGTDSVNSKAAKAQLYDPRIPVIVHHEPFGHLTGPPIRQLHDPVALPDNTNSIRQPFDQLLSYNPLFHPNYADMPSDFDGNSQQTLIEPIPVRTHYLVVESMRRQNDSLVNEHQTPADIPTPLPANYIHSRGNYSNTEISFQNLYIGDKPNSAFNDVVEETPFDIPLITHLLNEPQIDLKKFKEYFHETLPATVVRLSLLKRLHSKIFLSFKDIRLFNGLLLQASGSLLSKIPELDVYFYRYKGFCVEYALENLDKLDDSNTDVLLMVISFLNTSSAFQRNSVKEHFALSSGPGSLLKTAYENPLKFPRSFKDLKNHGDGLVFTAKYMWIPQYDCDVLWEFYDVIMEFGELFIESNEYADDIYDEDVIIEHFEALVGIVEFCMEFLEEEPKGYPVDTILELVQKWYSSFPSECFTFGSKTRSTEKVLYVLWFCLLQILDCVFPGGRYMFTYFLDGYSLLYAFNQADILKDLTNDKLRWFVNYCFRIIGFFSRRRALLLRNPTLNDDKLLFFDYMNGRFKPKSFDPPECCIKSFRDTVIKKKHYRVLTETNPYDEVTNSSLDGCLFQTDSNTEVKDNEQYSLTSQLPADLSRLIDTPKTISGSSEDKLEDVIVAETIDLLDNFNENTSMLNNDYDPRFSDPMFNQRIVFQPADVRFINEYIEDRKIIQRGGNICV